MTKRGTLWSLHTECIMDYYLTQRGREPCNNNMVILITCGFTEESFLFCRKHVLGTLKTIGVYKKCLYPYQDIEM